MPGVQRPAGQRRHPGRRHARLTLEPQAHQPVEIDVERELRVTVTWDDGRISRFDLEELRVNCLCAECRGRREQGLEAWPGDGAPAVLRIESARQVGNWGLNFTWNDKHSTGIYTWEILREWDEGRERATDGT